MWKQIFFLEGKMVGTVERSPIFSGSSPVQPLGTAFFCPLCARLWLLAPIKGSATRCFHSICGLHRPGDRVGIWSLGAVSGGDIPGALWIGNDHEWNRALPKALLQRELLLTIKHYEELNNERPDSNTPTNQDRPEGSN